MKKLISMFACMFLMMVVSLSYAAKGEYFLYGDKYVSDNTHSQIHFSQSHITGAKLMGQFTDFNINVRLYKDDPDKSSVEAVIYIRTCFLKNELWCQHMMHGKAFFNIQDEKSSSAIATFKSTKVEVNEDKTKLMVVGNLTLNNVTKSVTLHGTIDHKGPSPFYVKMMKDKSLVLGLNLTTTLLPYDFKLGVGYYINTPITIHIRTELVPPSLQQKIYSMYSDPSLGIAKKE